MTDNILNVPTPTREKGQRSLSAEDAYFTRIIPSWTFPSGLSPGQWRAFVKMQPVAVNFRDTLISTVQSLDWKITPRDSELRDELRMSVRYHTKLFEKGGNWLDLDWTGMLEWVLTDLMDLPFGTAVEVGRKDDSPEGRVMWFKPLDGGTLYPTLNKNIPVMQYYASAVQVVNFPKHAINRMYLSPRPEIEREGWGMAPPEKVAMAMQMLARGDQYYANLLLDSPPAGLLDLGDMDKDTALDWIAAFRTYVAGGGADGFKIPVLYEHTNKAEFIPFGKVPNDIMYDRITLKYASLVGAAYGMSLADIGLQATASSGETLAGSIRSERRTRKNGLAKVKKKLKFFFENMLPDTLQFDFIDMDDELATALGRARLANATAWGQLIDKGIFDRKEARLQTIQDGLVTISVPEEPPAKPDEAFAPKAKPNERPGMLGSPQAPSQGGDGEVKKSAVEFKSQTSTLNAAVESVVSIFSPNIREILDVEDEEYSANRDIILESIYSDEDGLGMGDALKALMSKVRFGEFRFDGLEREILSILDNEGLYAVNVEDHIENLKSRIQQGFPLFIGRAIVHTLIAKEFPDVPEMQERIGKSLEDYAYAYVANEIQGVLDEIRQGSLEVPETLRVRSVVRNAPQLPNITVEAPQISMPSITVTVPERSVETPVFLSPPDITVNVPQQTAPVVNMAPAEVNVNVPERSVTVNVPEQASPIVNVNVPEQPAPTIEVKSADVNVTVQPTPVEITNPVTVNVPRPVKEHQTVQRDVNGDISTTETYIIYEDK
jgi:hypothetical protein